MYREHCQTCNHFEWYWGCDDGYCTRFPKWIDIKEPEKHYCGEHSGVKKDG